MKPIRNELQKTKALFSCGFKSLTDDWKVLIDGNVETFVGMTKRKITLKITRIRKVDSKKDGVLYQIVLDKTISSRRWWTSWVTKER